MSPKREFDPLVVDLRRQLKDATDANLVLTNKVGILEEKQVRMEEDKEVLTGKFEKLEEKQVRLQEENEGFREDFLNLNKTVKMLLESKKKEGSNSFNSSYLIQI